MLLRDYCGALDAWRSTNPVSRGQLVHGPGLRLQLCRHRSGAGKLFIDVFRRGSRAESVEGAALLLGTAQGPVGYAHGGAVAHVLDDVCGLACGAAGHASSLEVRFLGKMPLLTTGTVDARGGQRAVDGELDAGAVGVRLRQVVGT